MKGRRIQILVVVITLSFVGLLAVQAFWIRGTLKVREAEFSSSVASVLEELAVTIEKEEAMHRMLGAHSPVGGRSVAMEGDLPVVQLGANAVADTSSGAETPEERRNRMAADRPLSRRIDPQYLDSLLKIALNKKGITTGYAFGVFSLDDKAEILDERCADMADLIQKEGFRVRLFPSQVTDNPHFLKVYFPDERGYLLRSMWIMPALSGLLLLIIMGAFLVTIVSVIRQKKVAEIRDDFINNMTHELKTPISTIGLACEALNDPDMRQSERQFKHFIGMIQEENKRLGTLVDNVLKAAVFGRGEMELRADPVNLHEVIQGVIRNLAIHVKKSGGSLRCDLKATDPVIKGDKVHLTNVVYNLIDNGIKYTPHNALILIGSSNIPGGIELCISDNGIGIGKDEQKKIFDRLYRVPTGNVHDVKGFGLGLSYVKAVVEKHRGEISVESEPGKGSTFRIRLPKDHEE